MISDLYTVQKPPKILVPSGYGRELPMRTIHVLRSGRNYFIDGIYWGDDEEGVMMYLKSKGVAVENITKVLDAVAREGTYTVQQE